MKILKMKKFEFLSSLSPWKHYDVKAGRQICLGKNWKNIEFHEWNYKSTMQLLISHVLRIELWSMSEKSVIFLAENSSSQADKKSAVQAAVSSSSFVVSEEKVAGERGEESPVGGPEGPTGVGGVCETEAGTEADVEDEDEDVDVVGGIDEVGVSGYESEDSRSKKFCVERDWRRRMCPRVSLTPLTFHNVSLQVFIIYH